MIWLVSQISLSLVVLAVSGDQFVIGLGRLAGRMKMRPTVVGTLIGGLGTSLPELLVAVLATSKGEGRLAVGSLAGSIIAAFALALASASLLTPVKADSRTVRKEAPVTVVAVAVFGLLALDGISRVGATALGVLQLVALVLLLVAAREGDDEELTQEVEDFFDGGTQHALGVESVRVVVGVVFMALGAQLLVRAAAAAAVRLGLSEGFVGLSVVAIGTSAPLIAASIQAARRGDHDLIVGSVLGQSLFLALLGGSLVGSLAREGTSTAISPAALWLMIGVTSASWLFMARGKRITRAEAVILLLAFVATLIFGGH